MKSFFKTLLAAFIGCIVALVLSFFLLIGIVSSLAALSQEDKPVVPQSAILRIDTSIPITEQNTDDPFASLLSMDFSSDTKTYGIYTLTKAINEAAQDPAIKFIYLNAKGLNAGMSQVEELRNALAMFRLSGKPIIAYGDNFSQADYYLCSVADKVYINKDGAGIFTGININMMFFKDLLNKLGINVQLIRHGKYKAAAEQFIANNISTENYQQNKEMVDSIWGNLVKSICDSRDITPDKFNMLIDNLELWNAQSLKDNNLVDEVFTRAEFTNQLCILFDVKKEKDIKSISIGNYAKAKLKPNLKSKDKIAVVFADGEITMDNSKGLSVKTFYPILNKIKSDSSIKAVVLRVNSPGGDAQAAEILNNELQLIRESKPIVVSMSNYAASGGYWIAAKSDKIFAENNTLTGSIGVFSLYASLGGAAKKILDINNVNISTNKHAAMLNGINQLDEAEIKFMQRFVEDIYVKFTSLVAQGRGLEVSYVDSIAQGRVWTGAQAVELKLVDQIGGLEDAIAYAAGLVSLDNYRLVEYPKVKSTLDKLMESLNESASNAKAFSNPYYLIESAYGKLKQESGLSTYARVPYIYEFNL